MNRHLEPTALADIHSHFNCAYDPQFGTRPLKRAVQEQLLNPLSMKLLEGEFRPGDKIKVGAKDGGVVFFEEAGLIRNLKFIIACAGQTEIPQLRRTLTSVFRMFRQV